MKNLIIDISELAYWQGKLTGVPRVMNELALRFSDGANCVFVVWDGTKRNYQKIDFEPTSININTSVAVEPSSIPSHKYARIIKALKNVKSNSMIARKTLSIPERTARKFLKPKPIANLGNVVTPKREDTVFVLADWHGSDEVFIDYLVNIKQQGTKLIQISYDMLPVVTPQYSGHATESFSRYTKAIYPLCDLILAISEHTKRDIVTWLKLNGLRIPEIKIMRLGDDFKIAKAVKPVDSKFITAGFAGKDYILCVGTVEARKNHTLLYYLYKLAKQKGIELPRTIVVGRRGWKTDDIFEVITNDPETKDKIVFLQHTSDEELSWLYQNCLFTIYPSFYEGWGLPIAESLAYGVPCISSNSSSMPEIAGDLITYFSPASTDDCLEAVTNMLKDGGIDKAKQTIKAYNPISWDQTFYLLKEQIGEIGV